jgi:hypothetical protein
LDTSGAAITVVGYDVALHKGARGILATWLTSSILTLPRAEQIRWTYLGAPTVLTTLPTTNYGTPAKFLSSDGSTTAFNCQERLCALDISKKTISLVVKDQISEGIDSTWIVLNKTRTLIAGVNNQLISLRPL